MTARAQAQSAAGAAPRALLATAQAFPLVAVAWGALAFGGVYSWAYWPLALVCAVSGTCGVVAARRSRAETHDRALIAGLSAVGIAIVLQLVPLPAAALALSPRTEGLLRDLNPAFAAGVLTLHPLSVWPRDTMVAFVLFAALAIFFIGTTRVLSVTGSRRLVEALTAFGVVLALIGIVQKPLYSGAIYGLWELEIGRLPFGPFVNRNHFAGWMLMALPLTLALLSEGIGRGMRGLRPGWRYKVLWFSSPEASQLILLASAAVVMALSLMLTMSRSGIAAFALSLLFMGAIVMRVLDSRLRRLTAATSLALLLVLVVTWAGPEAIAARFASGDWGEFNNRRGAWTDALAVIRDFPLAGTGLNTYWAASLFYQKHELTHFFAQAHNDYLQLAAEGGLLLVLPAFACLGLFVRDISRATREHRGSTTWWLRMGAVTSLLAIAFQETVEFSLQMPGNAVLFAVVCAVAVHRSPEERSPAGARETIPVLRLVPAGTPQGSRRARTVPHGSV